MKKIRMIFKLLFSKNWIVIIGNSKNYEIDYNNQFKYPKRDRADRMVNIMFNNTLYACNFLHGVANTMEYKLRNPQNI